MEWEQKVTFPGETRLLHVRYFVLPLASSDELSKPCYGIGVAEGKEVCTVRFFSPDRETAVRTARWLSTHRVTPVSFPEVMDDFLAGDAPLFSPQ